MLSFLTDSPTDIESDGTVSEVEGGLQVSIRVLF